MNNRIKEVRTTKKLTQDAFAADLNISKNYVWMIEKGEREPGDRTIKDICRIYGVNEEWLRTGEGEMMRPLEREEEIAKLANKMLDEVEPSIRNAFIRAVMATNNETLQALKDFSETFIHELNNPPTK